MTNANRASREVAAGDDPHAAAMLQLSLFGGVAITRGITRLGGVLPTKSLALLCYLAVIGRPQSRGALATLLWSEVPDEDARANLRQALTRLRPLVGSHLAITRGTVAFERGLPYGLDTKRFEAHLREAASGGGVSHLRAAVDLYIGDFMDGFAVRDAPAFEEWQAGERERLRLRALQALHELAVYHGDRAEYLAAGDALSRLLAYDPWREDAHRQLMLVLARSGQRDAALAQFAICRRVLAEELGTAPMAETVALYERIRAEATDRQAAPEFALPLPLAERRQLTLLDCALVRAAALAERLDPEDLHELVRAWQGSCAVVAARCGGRVVQYRADGALLAFGYPPAHDDSARRAVRAGLALLVPSPELAALLPPGEDPALAVRVGIHSGDLVVGGGTGPIGGTAAAGPAQLDLAGLPAVTVGRLQDRAQPGTLVLSESAVRLVEGFFDVRPLGALRLPGLAQPVVAYQVLAEGEARGRVEARAAGGGLAPLVGREEEVATLLQCWADAESGQGRAVLLTGEPGIGKSRLARVVVECAVARGRFLVGRCSAHAEQSALAPVVELLRDFIGARADDAPTDTLARLRETVAAAGIALPDALALLAELLDLPTDPQAVAPTVVAPRQQEPTLGAIVDLLRALAARRPTLLLIEDLHWADPSTRTWLGHLLDRLPAGLLVLLTARSEFRPAWSPHARLRELPLGPLPEAQAEALIAHVAGEVVLPAALHRRLVATAEGIPLFAEELTRMVLEPDPQPALAIPTTLRDTLAARLDRLGPAKVVAQAGSAIGREFSAALLAVAGPFDAPALEAALARLAAADLIVRLDTGDPATYSFKHALIRDAAYESLLRRERQGYHRRIAEWLEAHDLRTVAARPELLAGHFTAAGQTVQAVEYWLRAGQHALQYAASVEAADHLEQGIALLATLPATRERDERELAAQLALGPALIATQGHGAIAVARAYSRARELAHHLDAAAQIFPSLWGLWIQAQGQSDNLAAGAIITELFATAQAAADPALLLQAYHASWSNALYRGAPDVALAHADEGRILYGAGNYQSQARVYGGHDPGVCALYHAAVTSWLVGFPDRAVGHIEAALALARRLDTPFSLGVALDHAGRVYQFLHDAPAVAAQADALVALSDEHGMIYLGAMGTFFRGWAAAASGSVSAGLEAMQRGVAEYRATGLRLVQPYLLCLLAETCHREGQAAEALRLLDEAELLVDAHEERWWLAEIQRVRGEVLADQGAWHRAAEQAFRRALDTARRQGALALELRAAISLTRFEVARDQATDGFALLDGCYRRFTEGFATRDVREARELLASLGS